MINFIYEEKVRNYLHVIVDSYLQLFTIIYIYKPTLEPSFGSTWTYPTNDSYCTKFRSWFIFDLDYSVRFVQWAPHYWTSIQINLTNVSRLDKNPPYSIYNRILSYI